MDIHVNYAEEKGPIRIMNAVNNGPMRKVTDQKCDNFDSYKALKIPFARNHDASFSASYGLNHTVDVDFIFTDFDADPEDPENYDFALTDQYIETTLLAGTEVYYRLGSRIEHEIRKYNTLPPKDFKKWAVICEHIIRHMNEGWAEGHHYNIRYWEIWNEPDLDPDDSLNKRTWGGTKAEFFDLFEIAAKHLKKCFPDLKIGGPALSGNMKWGEEFLFEMKKREVPMDFFSWHRYAYETRFIADMCDEVRDLMDRAGYKEAESILNEWNYIKGWSDEFAYSLEQIRGIKGAVFTADLMVRCQHKPLDMLMYYDARCNTGFNGMWDPVNQRPIKGYYPFVMWKLLKELGTEVYCDAETGNICAVAAKDRMGHGAVMLTYFSDNDTDFNVKHVELKIAGATPKRVRVHVLDKYMDMAPVGDSLSFDMEPNSAVYAEMEI